MTYQDLLQIVELIKSSSQFSEFHLKVGDIEVELRRGNGAVPAAAAAPARPAPAAPVPSPSAAAGAVEQPTERMPEQRHGHVGGGELIVEPGAARSPEGHRAAPLSYPPGAVLIKSPMVGTFYRSPEPGARPFVEVGQQVEADTTVCIIEVMKLMNSIPAGAKGVVTHILVGDAEPVEFGQVIMVIEPR